MPSINNKPPAKASVPTKVPAPIWHQDLLRRPAKSGNAHSDPVLSARDKEHYVYATELFSITPNQAGQYQESFRVDEVCDFWLCNINVQRYNTSSQVQGNNRVGNITVRDLATNYLLFESVPCQLLAANAGTRLTGARSIWPAPYGFGAGGGFRITVIWPALPTLTPTVQQITFEGYKDYSHVG